MENIYSDSRWSAARHAALTRDANRCALGRVLGGCSSRLDVHHIVPAGECSDPYDVDNLVTVCSVHHPMVEALRRRQNIVVKCPHNHPYPQGRIDCERRLRDKLLAA